VTAYQLERWTGLLLLVVAVLMVLAVVLIERRMERYHAPRLSRRERRALARGRRRW
jgi:hypothetical protein